MCPAEQLIEKKKKEREKDEHPEGQEFLWEWLESWFEHCYRKKD